MSNQSGLPNEAEVPGTDAARPLASSTGDLPAIRPAGPDAIPDLPKHVAHEWDEVDQAIDESFPASDPPGQGIG